MKTFFKTTILVVVTMCLISCSNDDNNQSIKEPDGLSTETPITPVTPITPAIPLSKDTWVKITTTTLAGEVTGTTLGVIKQNYIIMMFDQPVISSDALPPIIKQVTTDANGIAFFDLNPLITSTTPKKYYFEAFVSNGTDAYTWKGISHYYASISKGTTYTTSIIVE